MLITRVQTVDHVLMVLIVTRVTVRRALLDQAVKIVSNIMALCAISFITLSRKHKNFYFLLCLFKPWSNLSEKKNCMPLIKKMITDLVIAMIEIKCL